MEALGLGQEVGQDPVPVFPGPPHLATSTVSADLVLRLGFPIVPSRKRGDYDLGGRTALTTDGIGCAIAAHWADVPVSG